MTVHKQASLPLDILLYQRGEYWVAHCVALDLVTSAMDVRSAEEDIVRACMAQVKYAYEENKLDHLFRPPNPVVSGMVLKAIEDGGLAVNFKSEVIDHKELAFRVFRQTAA